MDFLFLRMVFQRINGGGDFIFKYKESCLLPWNHSTMAATLSGVMLGSIRIDHRPWQLQLAMKKRVRVGWTTGEARQENWRPSP